MVLNVSSLLKTVKAVEDENTRGTRAMEATVEAISQEIRVSLFVSYSELCFEIRNFLYLMCNTALVSYLCGVYSPPELLKFIYLQEEFCGLLSSTELIQHSS